MSEILKVVNLVAYYGQTKVLNGCDFSLRTGGITTILGANGAGKTTTLRAVCGMVRTAGEIYLDGSRIDGQKTENIARQGVGHVPDGRGTILELSVEENLYVAAHTRSNRREISKDLSLVCDYFPPLKDRMRQQAGTLSGGEQQMLAIGRALMMRPKLLLLDEPSFGLAPLIVQEIFAIMRTINRQERVSMLLVEQNATLALNLADYAYLLETGNVVLEGTSKELQANPSIRRSYLGY